MTTKKLVPRASGEGAMGVTDNAWGEAYYDTGNFNKGLFVSGHNITQVIAETVTQGGLGGEWTRNVLDIYYNGGNVGIGTTDPGAALHVQAKDDSANALALWVVDKPHQNSIISAYENGDVSIGDFNYKDNTGRVGIGTADPGGKLEVNGGILINATLPNVGDNLGLWLGKNSQVQGYVGGGDFAVNGINDTDFGISSAANGNLVFGTDVGFEKMRIDPAGNVGIGTRDPIGPLHVSSVSGNTINLTRAIDIIGISGGAASKIQGGALSGTNPSMGGAIGLALLDSDASGAGTNTEGYLYFETKNSGGSLTEKMRIDSSGNVGIGIVNPGEKLHIHTGVGQNIKLSKDNHGPSLMLKGIDSANGLNYAISIDPINATSNRLSFKQTNDAQQTVRTSMVIDSTGSIGIGTTNPGAKLHVQKLGTASTINSEGINMTGAGWASYLSSASDQNGILRGVTIGVYRPTTNDNFSGVLAFNSRNSVGHYTWSDDSGNLRTSTSSAEIGGTGGTVVGTQTSDERLKNIESDFEYGLEQVMQLQPIAYILKDDQDEIRRLGFGAQTTQGIIPEVVYDTRECVDGYDTDPEDEHKTIARSEQNKLAMKYVELVPVLTKAIQEQQQLIEDLRSEVEALKNK